MAKRIKEGDFFEIETSKGKGIIQCVKVDMLKGETIRVQNMLHSSSPNIASLERMKWSPDSSFFIGFPLRYAYNNNIVNFLGNIPIEESFELPRYYRTRHVIGKDFIGWHIVDSETHKRTIVNKLNSKQILLSPWGSVNDTLLIEWLEKGWSLEEWI